MAKYVITNVMAPPSIPQPPQYHQISGTVDGKPVFIRVLSSDISALSNAAAVQAFLATLMYAAAYPVPVAAPILKPVVDSVSSAITAVGTFSQ
jgi:hypothetical protein